MMWRRHGGELGGLREGESKVTPIGLDYGEDDSRYLLVRTDGCYR